MEKYLSHFLENRKKVYYLNAAGRELVQAEKNRTKNTQVNHYLMRNDLYIAKGRPSTWQNEVKITVTDISLIADAAFISNKLHHFIEIDYKQSMKKSIQKIKRYKKLSTYNPHLSLIWVTTTIYRKEKLMRLCDSLKNQIDLWEDLK